MNSKKVDILINFLKTLYLSIDELKQTLENGYIIYDINVEKISLTEDIEQKSIQKKDIDIQSNRQKQLLDIIDQIRNCKRCELSLKRISTVPGIGPLDTKVMIVGEAPGEQEDIQGIPFVGKAGQLLTKLLCNSGIQRENIFITNCVKCRPPNNRIPTFQEMALCSIYLKKQINIIKPYLIITLGATSTQFLLQKKVLITKVRGILVEAEVFGHKTYVYPTFHPSYLLRDNNNIPIAQKDFDKISLILKKI